MNAHAELAIKALAQMRGDDLERFESRWGEPDGKVLPMPPGWWDRPAQWNPAMTPRETLTQLRERRAAIDWAIGWVKSKGG